MDEGRYVYYEGEILGFESLSGNVNDGMNYELTFEIEDARYVGRNVEFPNESILESMWRGELPKKIRWYKTEKDTE